MVATVFDLFAAVHRAARSSPKRPGEKSEVVNFPGTSFIYEAPQETCPAVARDDLILPEIAHTIECGDEDEA